MIVVDGGGACFHIAMLLQGVEIDVGDQPGQIEAIADAR